MSYSAPEFKMWNDRAQMCGDCRSSLYLAAAAAVPYQGQDALQICQGQRKNLLHTQKQNGDREALAG